MHNIWIELKWNVMVLSLSLLFISLLSRFLLIPPHKYCSLPVSSLFYIYLDLTFTGMIAKITTSLTFPRHSLHDIGNLSERWKADSVMTCLHFLKKKKILLIPIHFRIISKLLGLTSKGYQYGISHVHIQNHFEMTIISKMSHMILWHIFVTEQETCLPL